MEFGTLIQDIRKQKGYELRALAEKVAVDASTISRIENLHTQATVYTAFRICDGLGISLPDLINALIPNHGGLYNNTILFPIDSSFAVSLQEVVSIVREFEENREHALNKMLQKINRLLKDYHHSQEADYLTGPYSVGEIERYFFSSPFSEEYRLRYPSLKPDIILQIYEQNGALTPEDVEIYLKKKRIRNRSLPTSSIEKIKLSEVLQLLEKKNDGRDNDNVVVMIWEACRFLSQFGYSPQTSKEGQYGGSDDLNELSSHKDWEIRVAIFYITLCRWELVNTIVNTKGSIWVL